MKWEPYTALDRRRMVRLVDGADGQRVTCGEYEALPNGRFLVSGARKSLENEHDARAAVAMRALLRAENTVTRLHQVLNEEIRAASVPRETAEVVA